MPAAPRAASAWLSEVASRSRSDRSAGAGSSIVIARIVQSADFERVLRTRTFVNTPHFAAHRLLDLPSPRSKQLSVSATSKLSTAGQAASPGPVDDLSVDPCRTLAHTLWVGAVVPKKHARRAVTRTLLKRQIYAAVQRHVSALRAGLWVVRLRAPFDRATYVSAASDALKRCARDELDALLRQSARFDAMQG